MSSESGGARGADELDRHLPPDTRGAVSAPRRRTRRDEGAGTMIENPTTITAQPGSPFIEVIREFEAKPAQVFRAYTDPGLVTRWLGPREIEMRLIEYDARSGGAYRYVHRDAEDNEHLFHGVFHTVTPDERIIQTFEYEGTPDVVSLESTTF